MSNSTLKIGEVMTKSPHGIASEETLATALERFIAFKIRHLPVRSGGRVVGLLSERDAELIAGFRDPATITISEIMVPDPYRVSANTLLKTVAREMLEKRIGSALVVDKDEQLIGIFTDTDALRIVAQM